ncbi:hypothetical protein [Acetobacter senegalensis]|uniref:hypothetical protein n=1 Tax=Acetobacter senegalensis TaxID=446692 RepID=UPI00265166AE|nr:hypothetical protein [Acetobacter senegalensis]MDN7350578.1 hypothetical protein [Acetobacter senegalensis]
MTAVTEKMATDARKPEIKEMAENSYFLWCTYGRCYRQTRARYLNFIRMLRKHMKLKGFFFSIAAFLLRKKSKPLFFSASTALAPAVRPDDGCDGVIFSGWAL